MDTQIATWKLLSGNARAAEKERKEEQWRVCIVSHSQRVIQHCAGCSPHSGQRREDQPTANLDQLTLPYVQNTCTYVHTLTCMREHANTRTHTSPSNVSDHVNIMTIPNSHALYKNFTLIFLKEMYVAAHLMHRDIILKRNRDLKVYFSAYFSISVVFLCFGVKIVQEIFCALCFKVMMFSKQTNVSCSFTLGRPVCN